MILFGGSSFITDEFCDAGSKYEGKLGGDFCNSQTRELMTFKEIQERLEFDNPEYYKALTDQWDQGNFFVLTGMVQDER